MSALTEVTDRYAGWLELLSDTDRDWVRTRYAEVVELRAAEPDCPAWFEWYLGWTVEAIEAEDTAAALHEAVEAEDGDPVEVARALEAIDRTSDEWSAWWPAFHPSAN